MNNNSGLNFLGYSLGISVILIMMLPFVVITGCGALFCAGIVALPPSDVPIVDEQQIEVEWVEPEPAPSDADLVNSVSSLQ